MIQTLITFEKDGHSIAYVPPYLTSDVYLLTVDILARDWAGREQEQAVALAAWCAGFCDGETAATLLAEYADVLWDLSVHMVKSAGFTMDTKTQMNTVLNVWSGGDEYNAKTDPPPCTCVKCMGLGDVETLCKFKDISKNVMQVLDWSYLAGNPQYLNAPYSLYIMARLKSAAEGNGTAARRQARENEQRDRDDAKKTRNKHGHNW